MDGGLLIVYECTAVRFIVLGIFE